MAGLELPHAPVEILKQRMSKNFLQTIPKLIIRTADGQDSSWIPHGTSPSLSATIGACTPHIRVNCNPASKDHRRAVIFSCYCLCSPSEINQKADRDKFSFPSPKVHPGQFPKGLKLYPMLGRAYENRPHPMDMSPIRLKLEAFQILID